MKRDQSIDFLRLIGAFFIIVIHADMGSMPAYDMANIKLLGRWAVPFYFMASGYFLGSKYNKSGYFDLEVIRKPIGIYLVANLFYFPITIIKNQIFHIGYMPVNLEILFYGYYWHLWFISSLIFGYIILWFFISYRQFIWLTMISAFLIFFAVFADSYSRLFGISMSFGFAKFLLSVPFLYIGFRQINFNVQPKKYLWLGLFLLVAGVVLQFTEAGFFSRYSGEVLSHELLLGTVISVIGIFILIRKIRMKENYLSTWGKDYSLFIFIYHPFIILVQNELLRKLFPVYSEKILWFSPVSIFLLTLLSAIVLEKKANKIFRILNGEIFSSSSR